MPVSSKEFPLKKISLTKYINDEAIVNSAAIL